ncbi:MAG: DUF6526 family protein [Flavitalea sp.]
MAEQQYTNHVRYYAAHHFVFYPLASGLLFVSARAYFNGGENTFLWAIIMALWVMLIFLSFMTRQHYALTLQNRMVRLEIRFRYFSLTQQRFEPLEAKLSFKQIAALRFASDEEFPALVKKAVEKQLSPDEIKKSILQWLPDHMRV